MASLVLSGDTSGSITVSAPAVAGSTTQTLVNVTGTLAPIVSGTAVTASGTSVDFTGIPSWVKRITVMLSGVSGNGTSQFLVQIGSGSITSSGYVSSSVNSTSTNTVGVSSSVAGFIIASGAAADNTTGHMVLTLISGNTWVSSHAMLRSGWGLNGGGNVTLGGTLDRVRITTVNGTDTFDAGTINLLWE